MTMAVLLSACTVILIAFHAFSVEGFVLPTALTPWVPKPGVATSTITTSTPTKTTALFGIPKMFRWLTDQYPDVVTEVGLAENLVVDNLYLDMNGIIHPCTHGNNENGQQIYLDEAAMFKKIFLYVDKMYKFVKPTTVLYLAVDGVAPRAKMNQQRSRRFRSAKEAEVLAAEITQRENFSGRESQENKATVFDSNCITPGTDFMLKLSLALNKWVEYKLKTDSFWQEGATVILSGPDVPGEGEHKVMEFVRESQLAYEERRQNNGQATTTENVEEADLYKPGATHVLYGLDADLIMLGLVTHEPNFLLLREKMSVVMAGRGRNKYRKKKDVLEYTKNDFELLELKQLRKLLAIQFRKFADVLDNYSLDRVVDDFVFMCMLVGNDFLPHCPHLEIDGGAISLMMTTYIDLIPEWGGYLTDKEKINPDRFESFLYSISLYEEEHFKKRGYEEAEPGWKLPADNEQDELDFYGTFYSGHPTPECAVGANFKGTYPPPSKLEAPATSEDAVDGLDEVASTEKGATGPQGNRTFRRQHPTSRARSYRDFYYEKKLGWRTEDRERTLFQRRAHVRDYLEGLHWNLNYYHNGCASWDWYFPHLYSPLATDMVNLKEFYDDDQDGQEFKSFKFELGDPFPSLGQLLSVLPPQSSSLLPSALGELMLHPSSPLIPYYPADFKSDPNGKRQPWEAVVDLPFIDADILLETLQQVLDKDDANGSILSPSERRRNQRGRKYLFKPENKKIQEGQTMDETNGKGGKDNNTVKGRKKSGESTTATARTKKAACSEKQPKMQTKESLKR